MAGDEGIKVSVLNDRDIIKEVDGFDVKKTRRELEKKLKPVMGDSELDRLLFYKEYAEKIVGKNADGVAKKRSIRFRIRPVGKDPKNAIYYVQRGDGRYGRIDLGEYREIK